MVALGANDGVDEGDDDKRGAVLGTAVVVGCTLGDEDGLGEDVSVDEYLSLNNSCKAAASDLSGSLGGFLLNLRVLLRPSSLLAR